ncbi:SRPBCC family protein [Blastococcus sp. TML/M2B]|nr:SRPBCC family protein [Blastococcus sp. TML/M2B]
MRRATSTSTPPGCSWTPRASRSRQSATGSSSTWTGRPSATCRWGRYDVEVVITAYEPDREIAWTILGTIRPPLQHVYGYRLEPADGGTRVVSYCDWSNLREDYRSLLTFPIVPESALKGTLGILDRTVRRRRTRAA